MPCCSMLALLGAQADIADLRALSSDVSGDFDGSGVQGLDDASGGISFWFYLHVPHHSLLSISGNKLIPASASAEQSVP